jgi:pimeloyl-ACP methyl ester carboxylesterase
LSNLYLFESTRQHPAVRRQLAGLPTQVIIGAEEIAFIADMARAIAAAVPGARLHTVPGGGHMVNMENPAPVTALVASFVGGLPAA